MIESDQSSQESFKQISIDGIRYSLNDKDNTAIITENRLLTRDIFIPRSVKYESTEYIITSIQQSAFANCNLTITFKFASDSEVRTIEEKAFSDSTIQYLEIPASVTDLKDGWCYEANELKQVIVNENNPRYKNYDNDIVIGKTTIDSANYDLLVFCNRNIEALTIPNFIKTICPFSFENCMQLQSVVIPSDSQLRTIDDYAFKSTKIASFEIPCHLNKIGQYAFFNCDELQSIEIPADSELQTIGGFAFEKTN